MLSPVSLLNKFINPTHAIDLSFSFISVADGARLFSHQNLSVPVKESNSESYHLNGVPIRDDE